ncbi:anthocyanidin 3-O-glucosyltransferase 2-like [Mangifera indica]|uniref:anthocyanidin 3-O-glucosyltransferase 2-like n=1 Tax=Mangifera indica TaxID=29780 RepID=UPI001CFB8350|nr:anthocyanidin 3-O-glucosyltransferase 2-like [Mangifera indica]
MNKKAELVFIPTPGAGHLVSALELAKLLLHRQHQLSITVLIMRLFPDSKVNAYLDSFSAVNRINFVRLPNNELPIPGSNPRSFFTSFIESQKPHVKEIVSKLVHSESACSDSPRLAGLVLDMFCAAMIDVADELGVPSYIFYTSSAACLGLMFHAQALYDEQNKHTAELKDSDDELELPGLVNPIPAKVLPFAFLDKDWSVIAFEQARGFRRSKGIVVNSFIELESNMIKSLSKSETNLPPVYPVGPILNLEGDSTQHGSGGSATNAEIMEWLDDQLPSSVVFLCFGSRGSFGKDQVKEIAFALEQSGHPFLWSLRQPPPKGQFAIPSDYINFTEVLPEGFLDRTAGIGKVIGWAPQVSILAHKAIGGFVSHCGWNSTLESIWSNIEVATWPMGAEQQLNAFEMVIELGLAVEIKMDYRKDFWRENQVIVSAGEIERGIRKLMNNDNKIKNKLKEMSENSRKAMAEGGSSFTSLGCFIDDVMSNIS